jgi:hypothetical protein
MQRDSRGTRRDGEPPVRFQVVEPELDARLLQRDVGAALNVLRASTRVVDRLAVHGDPHHVQTERVLGRDLARERRDVHAVQVVALRDLVVDNLHDDV